MSDTSNTAGTADRFLQEKVTRNDRLRLNGPLVLLKRKPDPPLNLQLVNGTVSWEEPQEKRNITHYNVFSNGEKTLFARVPVGQVRVAGFPDSQVFVSSFNANVDSLESVRRGQSGTGGASGAATQHITLTLATTAIVPSIVARVGALLWIRITQDATGGRQITWDSSVKWATIDISTLPNLVTAFLLIGDTDPVDSVVRWFCAGLPMLAQTA